MSNCITLRIISTPVGTLRHHFDSYFDTNKSVGKGGHIISGSEITPLYCPPTACVQHLRVNIHKDIALGTDISRTKENVFIPR